MRQGDVLSRIGKMAELFDDHSPLALGASGKRADMGFVLVGRLQYKSAEGVWTEWLALQDDGETAVLAEDNGAYVYARPISDEREILDPDAFRVGASTAIKGKRYSVASNTQVALISAQGELPRLPPLGQAFNVIELRSESGEVLSIEFSAKPPLLYLGRSVLLEDLALSGLAQESAREEKGRQFPCPHCGASIAPLLASTKSMSCGSCNSLIDLSGGIGAELHHAEQHEPVKPLIALGSVAQLQGQSWQVVGFQHRMGNDPSQGHSASSDEDDEREVEVIEEHFGWSEYLLYNQKRGFIFVVDAEDGWSVVKPVTGAPKFNPGDRSASYLGHKYDLKYSYNALTTYAVGEFYWKVARGQKTYNMDFAKGASLLSMEKSAEEITWSSGTAVAAETITRAFGIKERLDRFARSDASPAGGPGGLSLGTIATYAVIGLVVLLLTFCTDDCDPNTQNCSNSSSGSSFRSSGGSFGGGSSGGGHK